MIYILCNQHCIDVRLNLERVLFNMEFEASLLAYDIYINVYRPVWSLNIHFNIVIPYLQDYLEIAVDRKIIAIKMIWHKLQLLCRCVTFHIPHIP